MSTSRLFLQSLLLSPALLLLSCGDVPIDEAAPPSDETGEASAQAPRLPEPMRVEGPMPQAPVSEAAIDCNVAPTARKDLVCWRWRCDRMNRSEGSWSGNLASCNAGDISTAGRQNALKLVNLYRFLGGLPAVTTDATKNAAAQKCALMQHANGTLSHTPPTTWKCYSADGASAAGRSNIAGAPGWAPSICTWPTLAIPPPSATVAGSCRAAWDRLALARPSPAPPAIPACT
jgi:uncharacterized protein YkwD